MEKALASPENCDKFAKLGLTPVGYSAANLAKFVDAEQLRWVEAVKTNSITVN